jgi:hypothetical protein
LFSMILGETADESAAGRAGGDNALMVITAG